MKQLLRLYLRVLHVLPKSARRFFVTYANLLAILSLLDAAAIGLLALLITPISSGRTVMFPLIGEIHGTGVLLALLVIGIVIIGKSAGSAGLLFWATRRSGYYELQIGQRLFSGYMRAPWVLRLSKNSSDLVRLVDSGVTATITSFMLPGSTLLSEFVTLAAITVVLALAQPVIAAVTLGYLGCVGAILYFWISRRARSAGATNLRFSMSTARLLTEMVGALKEVTLQAKSEEITNVVRDSRGRSTRARANVQFLGQLPRFVLEGAVIGGFLLMGAVGYLLGGETEALSAVALFAVAGFRMAPAVIRFQSITSQMTAAAPYVAAVVQEIEDNEQTEPATVDTVLPDEFEPKLIRFEDVTFRYPTASRNAIEHVSFVIPAGQTVAIVGASGSGKSTLIDLLLGLLAPTSGTVFVDDVPLPRVTRLWQSIIGYVPQHVSLFDSSIGQNVALTWLPNFDRERSLRALDQANLLGIIKERPGGIDSTIGEGGLTLSGGQRQRLGIARALYTDPSVLVLDEATSALDATTENAISDSISHLKGKKTVVLVAHRLSTVRNADVIYYMSGGRLMAAGTFEDLLRTVPDFAKQAQLSGLA